MSQKECTSHLYSSICTGYHSCSHKIPGINVCLQKHSWLCTPLPKFNTSNLCALQKLTFCKYIALLCHPKEALNHFHRLLRHLQESAKNTSLPSLFDALILALSIGQNSLESTSAYCRNVWAFFRVDREKMGSYTGTDIFSGIVETSVFQKHF